MMDNSCGDSRCWTKNDRVPTFHSATPRRRCETTSASVDESPSRGAARSDLARGLRVDDPGLRIREQPAASPTCSDPTAPVVSRSDNRWSTATLATPRARASFHDDWSQRATPKIREDRPRLVHDDYDAVDPVPGTWRPGHVGDGTQSRLQPRRGAGHQDPQRGGVVHRRQVEDYQPASSRRPGGWDRRTCHAGRRPRDGAAPALRCARRRRGRRCRSPPTGLHRRRGEGSVSTTVGSVGPELSSSRPRFSTRRHPPTARSRALRSVEKQDSPQTCRRQRSQQLTAPSRDPSSRPTSSVPSRRRRHRRGRAG